MYYFVHFSEAERLRLRLGLTMDIEVIPTPYIPTYLVSSITSWLSLLWCSVLAAFCSLSRSEHASERSDLLFNLWRAGYLMWHLLYRDQEIRRERVNCYEGTICGLSTI